MKKRRTYENRRVPFKLLIVFAVCFIIVGYASVTTVLDIKSNVMIGFNFDDVKIYIANLE